MTFSKHGKVQLLAASKYVDDLTRQISLAKTRVTIMSLIFTNDASTHALIRALVDASERGVAVKVVADAFTFSEFGGFFSPFKRRKKTSRLALANAERLVQAGISFTWLGDGFKLNPFAGVTHIKWSVVDDTCYVFGGVNLYIGGINESTDYMLRFADQQLADAICKHHDSIVRADKKTHEYTGFSGKNTIGTTYIDSGKRSDSVIYDRTLELATQAKHILYVSQYCPSGPLVKQFHRVQAKTYFNQPSNAAFPTNLLIWWDKFHSRIPSFYTRKKYLHAKFIIFTMPDGKKIAITGSHNFSHTGVLFGTREVALETADPDIVSQLEIFFDRFVQ